MKSFTLFLALGMLMFACSKTETPQPIAEYQERKAPPLCPDIQRFLDTKLFLEVCGKWPAVSDEIITIRAKTQAGDTSYVDVNLFGWYATPQGAITSGAVKYYAFYHGTQVYQDRAFSNDEGLWLTYYSAPCKETICIQAQFDRATAISLEDENQCIKVLFAPQGPCIAPI